jgi:hypothetical protein
VQEVIALSPDLKGREVEIIAVILRAVNGLLLERGQPIAQAYTKKG